MNIVRRRTDSTARQRKSSLKRGLLVCSSAESSLTKSGDKSNGFHSANAAMVPGFSTRTHAHE